MTAQAPHSPPGSSIASSESITLSPASTPQEIGTSYDALAVGTWLLVQLIALAVAAFGVPLWARYDQPGEDRALALMLAAQAAFAALLLPGLVRSWRAGVAVTLSALVFSALAKALNIETSPGPIVVAVSIGACWIAAICLLGCVARTDSRRALLTTFATAYALGGPLVAYLESTYGAGVTALPLANEARSALLGPVNAMVVQLRSGPTAGIIPPIVIAFAAGAVIAACVAAVRHRSRRL